MSYHLGSIASSSCLRTSTLVVAGGSKVFGSHSCLFFSHLYLTLQDLRAVFEPRVHIDGNNIVIEVPIIAFVLLAAVLLNVTLMCCLQFAPLTALQKDVVFVPLVIIIVKMNHGTAVAFDFMKRSISAPSIFGRLLPAEPVKGLFVGLFGQRQSPSLVPFCVHFACALPVRLRRWPRDTLGVGASLCVSIAHGVATTQLLLGWGPRTLFKFVFFAVLLSSDSLCVDGVCWVLYETGGLPLSADLVGTRWVWSLEASLALTFPGLILALASAHLGFLGVSGQLVAPRRIYRTSGITVETAFISFAILPTEL